MVLGLGLVLRVAGSRDVPGTEVGTGRGRGQGQVTWGCSFQYQVTGRRLSLG